MAEYNIYQIIKNEKKNINNISEEHVGKIFVKYYIKFAIILKNSLDNINKNHSNISFTNNIETIGNFVFKIFWCVLLSSFNIHITIFFVERAVLLFTEFISLSIEEKNYKIECNNYINDAIIFTFKKTIGNITLENIIDENSKNIDTNHKKYINLLKVRDCSFLNSKILNMIILNLEQDEIENNKKHFKTIFNTIHNIYQNIDIDKYLFFTINKILYDYKIIPSLNIIRIKIEIINEFIKLDFFTFNNHKDDIKKFTDYLDTLFIKYLSDEDIEDINILSDITKKKIYLDFKEIVLRYISY
jgi:hypothetical protein